MVDTQQQIDSAAIASPFLEFQHVSLQYKMAGQLTTVIDDVSLRINPGEFISIVGPSGCGKTSLLKMVSGLYPVQQGKVCLRGKPITKPLKNVGMAFQNPVLLPWRNTLKNVLLPLEIVQPYKREIKAKSAQYINMAQELLTTVGLQDFQHHLPRQLSGGMKQRASLCRALIHQPEILLLDEPFAALDAFTREEMWLMLQKLWQQIRCTSILVTHDLREAIFLSDTIYVMSARPSKIIEIVPVNLPRPRTIEMCVTDEFNQLFYQIRRQIQRG